MSENQFMTINRLPSKTWYWLKLNETHIRWQDETRPCVTLAENVRAGQADEAKFAAIRTGAGEQLESAMAGLPVTTIAGAQSETIRLRVAAGEGARQSGGVVHVQADEGQSVTVVEQIVPTGDGATALQTKLYAKKNAKICLVQLLFEGEGHTLINDVGGLCEENASIELVQLIVGEHIAVDGARVDLVGDGSKFESAMGYLAAKDQKVDINLIVNHIGRKTNCVIEADGSLNDRRGEDFPRHDRFQERLFRIEGTGKRTGAAVGRRRGEQDHPVDSLRGGKRRGQPRRDHRRAGRRHAVLFCLPRHG